MNRVWAKGTEPAALLVDGSSVTIRPVTPEDRSLLVDFVNHVSEEALEGRFFSGRANKDSQVEFLLSSPTAFPLVAIHQGKVIGHAAYYVTSEGHAEPSVLIANEYQARGLGTLLLEQLAEAASRSGVTVFEALVEPENHEMISVFQDLGFKTRLKAEPGLVRITFPTSYRPEVLDAFDRREGIAAAAAVERFLNPRSIAVIGAGRDPVTVGGSLFHNLHAGFKGAVYPVNRGATLVQSVPAYPSVLDCPGVVDLAIIVVPAPAVRQVAEECARKEIRSLVVISSGFSEAGPAGVERQDELVGVCRANDMRLIGPNCMGLINTDPEVHLNGQFSPYWPSVGRIGFLSQSGALGIAMIDYARRQGLGISSFVSVGNKADVSGNDLIQYWERDARTDVLLLYLESFGNPRKFARLARRVSRQKPIIAVKSGRSAAGFRATQSHTGALVAASDTSVDALFRQSGVIRTDTLREMFDVAALISTQPVPQGNRVVVVSNSGGAAILAADACDALGLEVPELAAATKERLRGFLRPDAAVRNPVDMTAAATPDDYRRCLEAVAPDTSMDALLVIFIPPAGIRPESVAQSVLGGSRHLRGRIPVLTSFIASPGLPSLLGEEPHRVPSYPFPESAIAALAHAARYGVWRRTPEGVPPNFPEIRKTEAAAVLASALKAGQEWLTPTQTDALLDCYGISRVRTVIAHTSREAARVAEEIGGRVALKAVAPGLVHKTEAGGVRLNLEGAAEVAQAAEDMASHASGLGLSVSGYLIQPMVTDGIEMLVGVVQDSLFGPVVVCGAGGVIAELHKDFAARLPPLSDRDAREIVRSLKTYPLLEGYRGGPHYDRAALEEVILRVGVLTEDLAEVAELDLNPTIVMEAGHGVRVVDARIRIASSAPPIPVRVP